jgi:DNA repair protein RecO (recombination protein O)
MYSKDKGLIKAVARGSKKTNSKLGGRMELLVANKLMLNKGKTFDSISQAEAINTFFNLRSDIDKLFLAMYGSEIVSNFGIENDPNSEDIYNLFYSFLNELSKAETKELSMLQVIKFQLKIMNILGYSIELNNCVKCVDKLTEKEEIYFSIDQGGILCKDCSTNVCKKVKVPYKIIEFLNTLLQEDFETHTKYENLITEKICDTCMNLLKNYIEYYSPKKFKTVEMLESIR